MEEEKQFQNLSGLRSEIKPSGNCHTLVF